MSDKLTAKEEIQNFVDSNEVGIKSQFKFSTLIKAAEQMFTANGAACPVKIFEKNGEAYLVNRTYYKELITTVVSDGA